MCENCNKIKSSNDDSLIEDLSELIKFPCLNCNGTVECQLSCVCRDNTMTKDERKNFYKDEYDVLCKVCCLPALELQLCAIHFDDYNYYKEKEGFTLGEYLAFCDESD